MSVYRQSSTDMLPTHTLKLVNIFFWSMHGVLYFLKYCIEWPKATFLSVCKWAFNIQSTLKQRVQLPYDINCWPNLRSFHHEYSSEYTQHQIWDQKRMHYYLHALLFVRIQYHVEFHSPSVLSWDLDTRKDQSFYALNLCSIRPYRDLIYDLVMVHNRINVR